MKVASTNGPLVVVEDDAGTARRLDPLARSLRELVRVNGELLGELALTEDLHRHVLTRGQTLGAQRLRGDLGAGVEARLEDAQVNRLRVRAELLERHRLLHERPAQ